jgi:uncharacterized membrane protein YGL010W
MFVGFIFIAYAILWLNYDLIEYCQKQNCNSLVTLIGIFILAWLGQFYGHYLEGKKPSFLKDIQFLLIGPAWLLSFIFKKLGIPY